MDKCGGAEFLNKSTHLEMGTPDLDDILKRFLLGGKRIAKLCERRDQLGVEFGDRCDVHRRWEPVEPNALVATGNYKLINSRIVRALTHINMVIRVHRFLAPQLPTQNLDCAIADHLVRVHVALSPASRLEHHQGKVVDKLARDYFVCRLGDGVAEFWIKAVGGIHRCRGFLEHPKCFDQRGRKSFSRAANVKVLK
jgi:hypothetical protein